MQNLGRINHNLNKTHAESIRISTKSAQNPSESQQNLCRIHHNLNKTHAESIRIPTKLMQNPSESQQNLSRIHQNLNKTYAESMRISTKSMQTPSEDKTIQPRLYSQRHKQIPQKYQQQQHQNCQNQLLPEQHQMPWRNATGWKVAKCHRVKASWQQIVTMQSSYWFRCLSNWKNIAKCPWTHRAIRIQLSPSRTSSDMQSMQNLWQNPIRKHDNYLELFKNNSVAYRKGITERDLSEATPATCRIHAKPFRNLSE